MSEQTTVYYEPKWVLNPVSFVSVAMNCAGCKGSFVWAGMVDSHKGPKFLMCECGHETQVTK